MCQLSGISKAGTKQKSTRIVDGYLFSTDYSLSTQLNLEHVVLNGGHWLSTVTVFSQQLPPSAFCVGCGMIIPDSAGVSTKDSGKDTFSLRHFSLKERCLKADAFQGTQRSDVKWA